MQMNEHKGYRQLCKRSPKDQRSLLQWMFYLSITLVVREWKPISISTSTLLLTSVRCNDSNYWQYYDDDVHPVFHDGRIERASPNGARLYQRIHTYSYVRWKNVKCHLRRRKSWRKIVLNYASNYNGCCVYDKSVVTGIYMYWPMIFRYIWYCQKR